MSISSSREFLKEIRRHPENFYIIHYSCQNLNDENEGLSPRITSIAVTHYATEQTVSFSTHAIAEEFHIQRNQVLNDFDRIERELLKRFFTFGRERRDRYWIHWNMRNLTYGFEHLEHRYRILGEQNAPVIPIDRRINLSDMIADRYGSGYATHPKMQSLMQLNGGIHRDFLNGEDEVQAFQNAEFIRMHNSTLSKVGFFNFAIKRMLSGKLRTLSKTWGRIVDRVFESRAMKTIGFLATLTTLGFGGVELIKIFWRISQLG